MNKREFIAELWQQVDSLCTKIGIKCSKCLDTKRLWITVNPLLEETPILSVYSIKYSLMNNNTIDNMPPTGGSVSNELLSKENETNHIVPCSKCCNDRTPIPITKDEDFYGHIGEKQILLFEDKDDTPSSRLEILKEVEKEVKEREITRITNLLIKRDREFADGSTIERFGGNETKEFSRTFRHNHLQRDCNESLETIVELHGYSWNKKHEIPIVFTWPDTHTHGYSWDVIEDENAHPIYFIMILQAQNYMNWLKIIDSCSLFSDEVHVQIKTYILYPKNDAALDTCHRIVADISRNQTLLEKIM